MAAAGPGLTEDQFLCSICLEVFTDPVTVPCGHNFCKSCITTNWDINVQCQCPMCKEVFHIRPNLRINIFISQMTAQFRESAQQGTSSSSEVQSVGPDDISCDVCTGTKLRALKSCLVCLASYCETHLEPHLKKSTFKTHQLINPVKNLKGRFCTKHSRPLELFCEMDQTCVCMHCMILDHKTHDVIPLEEAHTAQKAKLVKTEAKIRTMIQKRQMKIEEIKREMELSNEEAKRENAAGVRVFTFFAQLLERQQKEVEETVEEKKSMIEEQGKGLIRELEWEIFDLTKKRFKVEQLSGSDDDLDFLQNFLSLSNDLPTTDWTKVNIPPPLYEGTVRMALDRLFDQVGDELMSDLVPKLFEAELKRVQHYAVDVTLDPQTAHPRLIVSHDGKEVKHSKIKKFVKDSPERFSCWCNVLGKQSFSSGRFYFEVQVNENTAWDLGVVQESVNRKGKGPLTPQEGFWAIGLMNGEYTAHAIPPEELCDEPERVGVFVDYEEGVVSFYDVDAAEAIYTFTNCSFTEKLYPFLSPRGKSTPLIITPVNHSQ